MQSKNTFVPGALCICGTYFRRDGHPTCAMKSRLTHALDLLHALKPRPTIVASGGTRGTALCPSGLTEANLIESWLRHRGVHPVLRDDFSRETIGNLALVYCGFLEPLRICSVVFITDCTHSARVQRLADHILGGLVEVRVSASLLPFDVREAPIQLQLETAGSSFVDKLLREVPRGDPEAAFAWVAEHHRMKPYRSVRVGELKKRLREQLNCSDVLCSISGR